MYECIDQDRLDNVNNAMLFVLEYNARYFGVNYICEDGKITEIQTKNKTIKGVLKNGQN